MRIWKRKILEMRIFIITILFVLLISACRQQVSDEWVRMSTDQRVDVLFYFNKDTKNEDVNYFLNNVIGYPHPEGKGYYSMKGIQGQFSVRTQDYEGYAIELRKNITTEERENILNLINSSPLIFKVFEHVVPNEVVLDPIKAKKEKEDMEKAKRDNRPSKTFEVTNSSENR